MSGLDEKLVVNRVPSHIKRKYAKDPWADGWFVFFWGWIMFVFSPRNPKRDRQVRHGRNLYRETGETLSQLKWPPFGESMRDSFGTFWVRRGAAFWAKPRMCSTWNITQRCLGLRGKNSWRCWPCLPGFSLGKCSVEFWCNLCFLFDSGHICSTRWCPPVIRWYINLINNMLLP